MAIVEFALESRIQALGREVFHKVRSKKQHSPGAWWNSKLIEHSLKDEALKVQLFRFTDVLPTLKDSKQVARHLNEYFNAPGQHFPAFMSWGASLAGFSSIAASIGAMAIRKSVEDMARTFISGSTPAEAIKTAVAYRKKNLATTFDLLGEAVVSEPEAEIYFQKYLALLQELEKSAPTWTPNPLLDQAASGAIPRINLSIKISSMFSQLDPIDPTSSEKGLATRLEVLLDKVVAANAFLNIDMEDYRLKDLTLRIFKDLAGSAKYRSYRHFGIVLQAYLKDTPADIKTLSTWAAQRGTPVTVRLVKGAYWDFETIHARQHGWTVPVFSHKWESDACYETCARLILESYPHLECALGSHNIRSIVSGLAVAEALKLPQNALEIQGLYGMADPLKEALSESGYRMRVYMPFGELLPGMAYLVRRLLENTANDSFLKQGFVDGVSEDILLAKPAAPAPSPALSPSVVGTDKKSSKPQYVGQGSAVKGFVNEPELAFYTDSERTQMHAALTSVRKQFGKKWPLIIGGKEVSGQDGQIISLNPSRVAEVIGHVTKASLAQADTAISTAKQTLLTWRDTPVETRAEILHKAAEIMRSRKYELIAWEVFEAGKPWREADGDVAEAIDFLEYYALQATALMNPQKREHVPGEVNENFYQPRGVAAIIAPWNFPLAILTGMCSAALATGNTVIIKPAEPTPIIGALLMQILHEAGLPNGVAAYLPCKGSTVGAHLVTHPDVHLIAFTGSREVGLWINAEAAKTRAGQQGVKKVICEMGGKNAILVDDDADLDEAVLGVMNSAFGYAGQKCSACSRAIVVGTAYEPFLKRLQEALASIKAASADDPSCRIGPVIDSASQAKIDEYIALGKKEAKLAYEMDLSALRQQGTFVGPTIFRDVPPQSRIAQEEIFGPVLCVSKANDFDEALKIALDVPFALTGAIYSRSPGNIEKARTGFRVGNLYINRGSTGAKVDRQPFGGFKLSGIGSKAGGADYLLQFVEPRCVTENTMRRGFAPTSEE